MKLACNKLNLVIWWFYLLALSKYLLLQLPRKILLASTVVASHSKIIITLHRSEPVTHFVQVSMMTILLSNFFSRDDSSDVSVVIVTKSPTEVNSNKPELVKKDVSNNQSDHVKKDDANQARSVWINMNNDNTKGLYNNNIVNLVHHFLVYLCS